jgi:hypothetical protein
LPLRPLLLGLLALAGFPALLESVFPVNSAFDIRKTYVHFLYRRGRQIGETEFRVAARVLCRIFKALVEVDVDVIENANGKLPLTYYGGACKLPLSNFEPVPLGLLLVLWVTGIHFPYATVPEPSRTVVAVAAFSGLREAEIRGLRWTDYDGQFFNVRTSIWRTHEGQTKTRKSKNSVPIIEPLRKILAAHKQSNGKSEWIFAGEKKGRPLHLDNLCRREIKPIVGDRWHGWHAFRRGLATVLYSIGERAETAQTILRHEDVSTTQEHYLMLKSKAEGNAAMKRLSKVLEKKMAQRRVRQSVRQARMQNAK